MRLSLSHKMIVLVALPLLVQWGFLAWFFLLQSESEQALQRTIHAKEVADAIGRLRTDMYEQMSMAGAELSPSAAHDAVTRAFAVTLLSDYDTLLRLTRKDDPRLHRAVEQSHYEAIEGFNCLLEIKKSMIESPHDTEGRGPIWIQARKHVYRMLNNDFSEMAEEQNKVARLSPAIRAQYRKKQWQLLAALALASLGLAAASAIYLTRGLTLRLARVSDNARRLAAGQALHRSVTGGDDIARLDKTFHLMAKALKAAEAARQEVVVMVTHDLRTPLATLENILKFLLSGNFGKFDQKGSDYILVANRNVARMSNLVDDLLDIEKVKSGLMTLDKQPYKLAESFTAARELSGAFAEEAGVTIEAHATDLIVSADRDRVTRVLNNLVANAVKFSPPGGIVTVRAKLDGNWVSTSVDDQGPGIAPDQVQHIFERFHQVESASKKGKGGSGLGLTICQAIVDLHGGKIWVENLPEKGSRFIFTLPVG